MNSKAKAEGRKCSDYLCYEAERAAACMTLCLPHTLVEVRAGLRAMLAHGLSTLRAMLALKGGGRLGVHNRDHMF